MALFTVRIELVLTPQAAPIGYRDMIEKMEGAGFSRIIVDSKGNKFYLPAHEFCFNCDYDMQYVMSLAKVTVSQLNLKFTVLVTEVKSIIGDGFEKPLF